MNASHYEQIGVAMTCRGFEEYRLMFDLSDEDLQAGPVLDVAAGGSSFTADARARGLEAFAVDPRYVGDAAGWVREAREEIAVSTAKLEGLREKFDWSYYGDVNRHRQGREQSLDRFAAHMADPSGKQTYIAGQFPELPFEDRQFALVLCSHFLFLYAEQFGFDFHRASLLELIRICKPGGQIRIYPLLSLRWDPYPRLEELLETVREAGCRVELRPSRLPFIPGSDRFVQIVRTAGD